MMLERKEAATGVVFYVSPLLRGIGVPHAFSTRIGGVSAGPFASLNLGNPGGCDLQDDPAAIQENQRRLAEAAGLAGRSIRRVRQVHGSRVVRETLQNSHPVESADAMVSDDIRCALSVRVADCVPILLANADGRWVAAVHAGWRGALAGVVGAAVEELTRLAGVSTGRQDQSLVAAIGPCIGLEAFEVGQEVLDAFSRVFGQGAPMRPCGGGKGHVDLRESVRLQLVKAGLDAESIDTTDRCTFRHADEFFSHRREHGMTGRLAALVSPAA